MPKWLALSGWFVALAVSLAAGGVWLSGRATGQETETYLAPRLPGTSNPDLTGIWQAFVTANWDIEDHSAQAGPFPRLLGVWGAQLPGQTIGRMKARSS
jgi:hypothetical protein